MCLSIKNLCNLVLVALACTACGGVTTIPDTTIYTVTDLQPEYVTLDNEWDYRLAPAMQNRLEVGMQVTNIIAQQGDLYSADIVIDPDKHVWVDGCLMRRGMEIDVEGIVYCTGE